MRHVITSLILCFQLVTGGLAQEPQKPPPPPQKPDEQKRPTPQEPDLDVVKITTNLVQIDAVVTDGQGKRVTDLRADEVEMLEDGKPQAITNFSYIDLGNAPIARPIPKAGDRTLPPEPPRKLRPEEVRRTIALVVDDLGLSFESAHFMRQALRKFLDQQMQPNDLVAIIRTAGGIGALQQFTSDKRQLYAAVEKVKWYPFGRGGVSAFAPMDPSGLPPSPREDADGTTLEEELNQFREDLFAVGTLGALNYVVRGLRELPGRKSVILFSDGLRIFNRTDPSGSSRILFAMRRLLDLANRASVVINTMDARGLQVLGLTAADSTRGMTAQQVEERLSQRRSDFFDSQSGLDYLASQTGGLAIRNTNDLSGGIKRVMEDQSGYYLIGYRPDDSTFHRVNGRTKFHKVSLKIKRPGKYNVRMRTGFFGVSDENLQPPNQTPQQQLIGALVSPFSASGVQLRLTSLFANDPKVGSLMRSFLHVKGTDLTFTKEPDGTHKGAFDILAVTFGDNGMIVDQMGYTHTMTLKEDVYERVMKGGLTYNLTVPVKKTGAYQLRTALRDHGSGRIGSATQFIDVPDFKKDRLTTSGLLLKGMPLDQYSKTLATTAFSGSGDNTKQETDPMATTAVRQFRTGMALVYGFIIYNPKIDKATGKPQLKTQVRLFRNGELIFSGKEIPYDVAEQTDLKRLGTGGAILLGTDMTSGDYVFQIVVTDELVKDKRRTTTQWMDFEIVK
jgi:VWFA-related protein